MSDCLDCALRSFNFFKMLVKQSCRYFSSVTMSFPSTPRRLNVSFIGTEKTVSLERTYKFQRDSIQTPNVANQQLQNCSAKAIKNKTTYFHIIKCQKAKHKNLPLKMPIYQQHHLSTQKAQSADGLLSRQRLGLQLHLPLAPQTFHTMLLPKSKRHFKKTLHLVSQKQIKKLSSILYFLRI